MRNQDLPLLSPDERQCKKRYAKRRIRSSGVRAEQIVHQSLCFRVGKHKSYDCNLHGIGLDSSSDGHLSQLTGIFTSPASPAPVRVAAIAISRPSRKDRSPASRTAIT